MWIHNFSDISKTYELNQNVNKYINQKFYNQIINLHIAIAVLN